MNNNSTMLQLCRLCLVKDNVNIPIFEGQGDISQIFQKISSCLPVKVTREDKLPQKICDGCSYKLDIVNDFRNTTVNAEKQLLTWLSDATSGSAAAAVAVTRQTETDVAQQIKPAETFVKQEAIDPSDVSKEEDDVKSYMFQDKFELPAESKTSENEDEPPPKRAKRTAAVKAAIALDNDSDEDDDDSGEPLTKVEDESDEGSDEDHSFVDIPSTSADDQPGPSGVNKDGGEAPSFDTSILNNLIFGPGLSITPVKQEPETQFAVHSTTSNPFDLQNGFLNLPTVFQSTSTGEEDCDSSDSEQRSEDPLAESSLVMSMVKTNWSKHDRPIDFSKIIKTELEIPETISTNSNNTTKSSNKTNIIECLREKTKKKRYVRNKHEKLTEPPVELDEPIHCDVCNITYRNNVAFALHSDVHSQDGKFSCHLCNYKNASKYHIEMHMRAHEGTTKYKCEICGKAFTVSTHAIEHKYFHTGEKPFQCEICGKHFMFSWFLTSHRRTQHWEIMTGSPLVKYDCKICNKHYTSSTGLKRHNYSKHNAGGVDASVLCDICGKRLSNKEKLKFHRRIHTGYKPFSCEICSKSFSRKEQLKEHERVHTGEKPYICKFCGKGFTQRSPLRIHERTHTGERPYVCMICGKGFISKGVMDTHMKSCSASMTHSILS